MLEFLLVEAGYQVSTADQAATGLQALVHEKPDLLILDLGLPDMDGCQMLQQLREWSSIPVIILSARPDPADKVKALDLGADDYLTKPFHTHELLARIRALLRRRIPAEENPIARVGDLTINFAAHEARVNEQVVALTPIEFALLSQLMHHPGRILTHAYLLQAVWGPKSSDQDHYLRVHFTHLRRKLFSAGMPKDFIRNEPGIGYRLMCDS